MSGNIRAKIGDSSWINKDPYAFGLSKSMRRNILYFRRMALATPSWADHRKICKIYKECKRLRDSGLNTVVDHIVPLNSKYVSGLHCDTNLQILFHRENEKKSNKYWPDMWENQLELWESYEY